MALGFRSPATGFWQYDFDKQQGASGGNQKRAASSQNTPNISQVLFEIDLL